MAPCRQPQATCRVGLVDPPPHSTCRSHVSERVRFACKLNNASSGTVGGGGGDRSWASHFSKPERWDPTGTAMRADGKTRHCGNLRRLSLPAAVLLMNRPFLHSCRTCTGINLVQPMCYHFKAGFDRERERVPSDFCSRSKNSVAQCPSRAGVDRMCTVLNIVNVFALTDPAKFSLPTCLKFCSRSTQ